MTQLVTVTSYGRSAGSARVRVFDWLDWLGLDAESETYADTASNSPRTLGRRPGPVVAAEWRLRGLARRVSDRPLLISRQASPFSRGGVERRLLAASAHGVYDFDDALYLRQAAGRWSAKPRVWANAVSAAAVVIAGNDTLAEQAGRLNPNTVVIPSCVDPATYERKRDFERSSPPRAVWIGSPSTESYLAAIADPLLRVHRSHGFRLTVISGGEASLGELDLMIDRVPWGIDTFPSALVHADFGVMPLPDTPWTRGKCAYKLLQYGAAGLPLIGSPVGVNREVLRLANGLGPATGEEWTGALEQLIDEDAVSRSRRGADAWNAVSRAFSFQAWQGIWRRAVGDVDSA